MINRDYIMRMIEQLSQVVAKVLLLKEANLHLEALEEINNAGKALLGLNAKAMEQLSDRELLMLWTVGGELDAGKCSLAAGLFKTEGEILDHRGESGKASASFRKGLSLIVETICSLKEGIPSEIKETFRILLEQADIASMPLDFQKKVFRAHGFVGNFAKAEDILFGIVREDRTFVGEGKKFYQQLLKRTDSELDEGNLPRDEVVKSLAELDQIR
jgi:hypothetical protein